VAVLIKFLSTVVVPKVTIIACAAINAANVLGLKVDMFVTSGNDKTHKPGSKHYTNEALDFRTKHMTRFDKHAFVDELKRRLGKSYDVILEDEGGVNEHCHAEHDPK
jgi:hypothetical protein